MLKRIKIITFVFICLVLAGNQTFGQIKGESGLKWYSWNASGGYIMPIDLFHSSLGDGARNTYKFTGTPGFTFTLGRPIGLQFIVGADLEDYRINGTVFNYLASGIDSLYKTRMRTYSLFVQFYIFPDKDINPYIMGKAGYSGINRAPGEVDLSRTIPANLWQMMYTAGTGITYHMDPNFSINLYGEFSLTSNRYLRELFTALDKKTLPKARIVLTLTGHTDIRVFYPFFKGLFYPKGKYEQDRYFPFYDRKKGKKRNSY